MKFSEKELQAILSAGSVTVLSEHGGNPQPLRTATGKSLSPWKNERQFMFAVLDMCKRNAVTDARWGLLYHIQNERGHHNRVTAGMPDLHLPVASADGKHGSIYIELKIGSNKPSREQREMIARLRDAGNMVHVIWDSVDEVELAVTEYLRGD